MEMWLEAVKRNARSPPSSIPSRSVFPKGVRVVRAIECATGGIWN